MSIMPLNYPGEMVQGSVASILNPLPLDFNYLPYRQPEVQDAAFWNLPCLFFCEDEAVKKPDIAETQRQAAREINMIPFYILAGLIVLGIVAREAL